MDIKIYNTHDPINKVSKSLSDVRTIENVRMLHRENSKTNLRVYLGNVGTLETFNGNYASLTGFGITRYYFITEIGSEKSFIYLDLKEDVAIDLNQVTQGRTVDTPEQEMTAQQKKAQRARELKAKWGNFDSIDYLERCEKLYIEIVQGGYVIASSMHDLSVRLVCMIWY